jgi:hypothetical protein
MKKEENEKFFLKRIELEEFNLSLIELLETLKEKKIDSFNKSNDELKTLKEKDEKSHEDKSLSLNKLKLNIQKVKEAIEEAKKKKNK